MALDKDKLKDAVKEIILEEKPPEDTLGAAQKWAKAISDFLIDAEIKLNAAPPVSTPMPTPAATVVPKPSSITLNPLFQQTFLAMATPIIKIGFDAMDPMMGGMSLACSTWVASLSAPGAWIIPPPYLPVPIPTVPVLFANPAYYKPFLDKSIKIAEDADLDGKDDEAKKKAKEKMAEDIAEEFAKMTLDGFKSSTCIMPAIPTAVGQTWALSGTIE